MLYRRSRVGGVGGQTLVTDPTRGAVIGTPSTVISGGPMVSAPVTSYSTGIVASRPATTVVSGGVMGGVVGGAVVSGSEVIKGAYLLI